MIVSIDWRLPATSLPVFTNKCCQKYEFYRRKCYQKSNTIRITAIVSTLWRPFYLLFSCCSILYRLEVIPRCCNNLSYIFIHTYYHYQASKAKQMVRQTVEPVVMMLPSTKTLLYDAFGHAFVLRCSFLRLLSKMTHSFACTTNRIVAGVLQSIKTITHAWSVSTSSQSTLLKSKTFSYCMEVLE